MRGQPTHLAFGVGEHVAEVHEVHVRQVTPRPPRREVVMMRPERPPVGLPLEPSLTDPARPQRARIGRAARELRARTLRVVEQRIRQVRVRAVVVPQGHEHVARVPPDHDVLRLGEEADPVGREVTLDEPLVGLRVERRDHRLDRPVESRVDPRRGLHERRAAGIQPEHERGQDPLGPRGPGLVGRGHDDVAVANPEMIPPGAVQMVVAVLVGALRRGGGHVGDRTQRVTVADTGQTVRPIAAGPAAAGASRAPSAVHAEVGARSRWSNAASAARSRSGICIGRRAPMSNARFTISNVISRSSRSTS